MKKFFSKMTAMLCVASLVVALCVAAAPREKVSADAYITSISFKSAGTHYLYEGDDQYLDKDDNCYYYYMPDFLDGDQITINLSDGTKDVFTYETEYADFFNTDDECLDFWNDDDWGADNDEYYPNLWNPGNHKFVIDYCGEFKFDLPVVVVGKQQPTEQPTQQPTYAPIPVQPITPAPKELGKVTGLKVKSVAKKSIKISWKKVANAKTYQVKVGSKSYKTSKTALKVKNKKFKKGKKVTVKVRATASGYTLGAWATKKAKIKK